MYYFYGCGSTRILEKLMCRSCGLYLTTIRIIESNNVFRDDLLDSDTYRLWYDCLEYPGRDMMIRILKTSHGHPFYRANRSKNQKLIQRDETVESKYKNATVRRSSTGRCNIVERSTLVQGASSNGRVSWRPVDQKLFLPLATNSSSLQVPPMTKFSWSNPDSSIDQDTSYICFYRLNG